jgi:type IV pilus assembly protein PilB
MKNNKEELENPFLDYNTYDEDDDKTIIMDFEQENLDELIHKKQEENTFTDLTSTHTNIKIDELDKDLNPLNKLTIHNPIKELITKYNLLPDNVLLEMQENNNLNLESLINSFAIDSTNLYKLLSKELSIKFFNDEEELSKIISDKVLDIEVQRNLGVLSIIFDDKEYFLVPNPFDYELRDYLKNVFNKKVHFALCKKEIIKKSILRYIKEGDVKFSFSLSNEDTLEIMDKDALDDLEYKNEGEIPIIPLVNYMILNAYENRASDIHIEPTQDSLTIRYRVDGVLRKEINLPNLIHKEVISRIKIIAEMNVAEKRLPQDGRFSLKDKNNKNLDIRVSTFPTVYGEKLVMRLLEQDALKPSLEELNLNYEQLKTIKKKINSPYGLILISGPTGSGKTTTLYSALSSVDKESLNVLTVENPVEYRLDGVHQMQVNEKIGLSFAKGLKTILRQDPDIILVSFKYMDN